MDFFKELLEINNRLIDDTCSHRNTRLFTLSKTYLIPFYERKLMRLEKQKKIKDGIGDIQPSRSTVNCIPCNI